MPINASFEYLRAEKAFLAAQTTEEKIACLEEMIRTAPDHKGAENLRAQLRLRLAKLKKAAEKERVKKKGKSIGIKKEGDAQVVMIGPTKAGRSSLLAALTNAKPKIADYPFTTQQPEIGTIDLDGIKIQLIELPANASKELFSIARTADLLLIVVTSLKELIETMNLLNLMNISTTKVVVLNKIDTIDEEELKKFNSLKGIIKISVKTKEGLENLKQKIFENTNLIRIFTKKPNKKADERPLVIKKDATISDVAEKIKKGLSQKIKSARIWGKSAKFQGQIVGIDHILADKDIVELRLR